MEIITNFLLNLKKNGSDSTTSSTATLFDRPRPFARACRNVCKWEAASLAPFAYANEQWPCNGNRVGRPIGVEIKVIATISTVGSVESKRQKKKRTKPTLRNSMTSSNPKKRNVIKKSIRFHCFLFCFVFFKRKSAHRARFRVAGRWPSSSVVSSKPSKKKLGNH